VEYGEDNTPEDVSEYTDILEEFRDVFAWNMAEMTTIKEEQYRIPATDLTPVLQQHYRMLYAEKEILAEQMHSALPWKNGKRLDSLDLRSDVGTRGSRNHASEER
jgi:hypothetical protein